ncbi:single-stranded DNA-binding protein [Butyrivibrio sp. AC2005]|uniref:single-stranded DNA-binding protein n=1 Tax=Butyrivibrio sp. AC2005 TaxID=1280672 RepID=UPI00047E44D2
MNKCLFTGRLTKDPEVRYTQGENPRAVARFSLAIDKQDKEHNTGYINVVAFGKLGEFAEKYLHKGMKIELESHVTPSSYEKDGRKIYTYDFQADKIDFAESKNASQGNSTGSSQPAADPDDDGFMDIPEGIDDELPFN